MTTMTILSELSIFFLSASTTSPVHAQTQLKQIWIPRICLSSIWVFMFIQYFDCEEIGFFLVCVYATFQCTSNLSIDIFCAPVVNALYIYSACWWCAFVVLLFVSIAMMNIKIVGPLCFKYTCISCYPMNCCAHFIGKIYTRLEFIVSGCRLCDDEQHSTWIWCSLISAKAM